LLSAGAAGWVSQSAVAWRQDTIVMATILIFVATYAVIAIGKLPGFHLDRAGAALLGASLMARQRAFCRSTTHTGRSISIRSRCCLA
jgi:hypothetical protein